MTKLSPRKNKGSKYYLDVVFECGDESEGENKDGEETSSTADDDIIINGDDCLDSHIAFLG